VSAYLVTKSISAGALLAGALAVLTGHRDERGYVGLMLPTLALVFAAITGVLLIADLKQPRRFAYLFTKPNWASWVVRGAWTLLIYGLLASVWLLGGLLDLSGLVSAVAGPTAVAAAAAAGYTAFLFGQCEGRDAWQTPLLLPTLLAQAGLAGAGAALVVAPLFDLPDELVDTLAWLLLGAAVAFGLLLATELASRGTVHVEMAKRAMTHGRYQVRFVSGVILGVGVAALLAVLVLTTGSAVAGVVGGLAAVAGLVAYEDAFVRAGQSVPLS
jgi:predicted membrane protein